MVKKRIYFFSLVLGELLGMALGFINYGPWGIATGFLANLLLAITLLLGFIPVVGVGLYAWIAWFYILPWIAGLTGAGWGWSLTVLFVYNLIISAGCTAQMIIRIFTSYWSF